MNCKGHIMVPHNSRKIIFVNRGFKLLASCTLISLYGGGLRELRSCSRASLVSRCAFNSWNLFAASSSALHAQKYI